MPHHTTNHAQAPATAGNTMQGLSRFYDILVKALFLGREGRFRRAILDQAQPAPSETILDVGCGTGTLTLAAKERTGPSSVVHGIDATPGMIEIAQRKAGKAGVDVEFQVGLIEEIPFSEGTFDLVLSSLMLHHLPEKLQQQGLEEISRVLRPGGRLIAVDFAAGSHSIVGHLFPFLSHKNDDANTGGLVELLKSGPFGGATVLPTSYKQFTFARASKA